MTQSVKREIDRYNKDMSTYNPSIKKSKQNMKFY